MNEQRDGVDPTDGSLTGSHLLLVGALGGLGRAVALAAGAAGARLILAARQVPALERLADAIEAEGGPPPLLYPVDLAGAVDADYERMADAIRAECGTLHAVVHLAARFAGLTPLGHVSADRWREAIAVNVEARRLIDRATFGLLRESGGRIVHGLDDLERVGRAYWGAYGVAQHALRGLLRIEADEGEAEGVLVVGFEPPPMRTRLRAMAYVSEEQAKGVEPESVAPALLALLDRRRPLTPGACYRWDATPPVA